MRSTVRDGSACAGATTPRSTVTTVTVSRTALPSHGLCLGISDEQSKICRNRRSLCVLQVVSLAVAAKSRWHGCSSMFGFGMSCALLHGFAGDPAVWDDVIAAWALPESPIAVALPG